MKTKKCFNVTGVCIPEKHYMVDLSGKIKEVFSMIERGDYFTIHCPRQYGKTTLLAQLTQKLRTQEGYFPIKISFEGIGSTNYQNEKRFLKALLAKIQKSLQIENPELVSQLFSISKPPLEDFIDLDQWIDQLIYQVKKRVVLIIDEVDQAQNNQLFLDFLGVLRAKYLLQKEGSDMTFFSVILAGVHDVKTLKLKLRPEDEKKWNSPWNIAADFQVDLCFSPKEIETLLQDYLHNQNFHEKEIQIQVVEFAKRLFHYTSGYPFLVSRLCKFIDEELTFDKSAWSLSTLEKAVALLLKNQNSNFDSLIKNLENHPDLTNLVFDVLFSGAVKPFNLDSPLVKLGVIHGVFQEVEGRLSLHNPIYTQRIMNFLQFKMEHERDSKSESTSTSLIVPKDGFDLEKVLLKFQSFMKENYSIKDSQFLERNGTLIFLAFLKPILNGKGFDFKEPQISEEKRLDIVITYLNQKFVLELKIWRGEKAHEKGLNQLCEYLEYQSMKKGYLLIFDLRKKKREVRKHERLKRVDKEIFSLWV